MNPLPIPKVDLRSFKPVVDNDLSQPAILGYSAESWVDAYHHLGPVFQDSETDKIFACGDECNNVIWRAKGLWGYRDTSQGDIFITQLGDGYITASDGEYHRDQRRLLRPALTGGAVTQHTKIVRKILHQGLSECLNRPVDLHDELVFLYTKALNNTMVKTGASDRWINRFSRFEEEFIRGAGIYGEVRAAWYSRAGYQELRSQVMGFFETLVDKRLAGETAGDSLDILLESMIRHREGDTSKEELVRDAYMMQAGGAGNIATVFCNLLWALKQHPTWLDILRGELKDLDLDTISKTGVKNLPATKAIILEAERCFAPTSIASKVALQNTELMGYVIPKNTEVFHVFSLHNYLPENYKNPTQFDPSRWQDKSLKRAVAFGGGEHFCAGKHVASLYILVSVITLIPEFLIDASQPPGVKKIDMDDENSPTRTTFMARLNTRSGN